MADLRSMGSSYSFSAVREDAVKKEINDWLDSHKDAGVEVCFSWTPVPVHSNCLLVYWNSTS